MIDVWTEINFIFCLNPFAICGIREHANSEFVIEIAISCHILIINFERPCDLNKFRSTSFDEQKHVEQTTVFNAYFSKAESL